MCSYFSFYYLSSTQSELSCAVTISASYSYEMTPSDLGHLGTNFNDYQHLCKVKVFSKWFADRMRVNAISETFLLSVPVQLTSWED